MDNRLLIQIIKKLDELPKNEKIKYLENLIRNSDDPEFSKQLVVLRMRIEEVNSVEFVPMPDLDLEPVSGKPTIEHIVEEAQETETVTKVINYVSQSEFEEIVGEYLSPMETSSHFETEERPESKVAHAVQEIKDLRDFSPQISAQSETYKSKEHIISIGKYFKKIEKRMDRWNIEDG